MITPISVEQFWDYYFRNAFQTLERKHGQYTGTVLAESADGISKRLFDTSEPEVVSIDMAVLQRFDYRNDGRFSLALKRPTDASVAYTEIVEKTYPYREPAPFGKQRMSELFSEIHMRWHQTPDSITLSGFEEIVIHIVGQYRDSDNQQLAALAWFLGEQRQRSSAKALLAIVNNAGFVPFAQHPIHFTSVDAVLSALWKVNDKGSMGELLTLMRNASNAGKRKIAPLFERLVSTTELLSQERCGENYLNPEFWERFFAPRSQFTNTEWDRYDTDSLFWEIRLLSALRLSAAESIYLDKLANDEVKVVGDTARKQLLK